MGSNFSETDASTGKKWCFIQTGSVTFVMDLSLVSNIIKKVKFERFLFNLAIF